MSDERQIVVPASFLSIYTPVGQHRPTPPRQWLEERHDWCEDLAQLLLEQVKTKTWTLGITTEDAVARVGQGLADMPETVSTDEAVWVLCRLKELLSH
jgi:hypothetical protein